LLARGRRTARTVDGGAFVVVITHVDETVGTVAAPVAGKVEGHGEARSRAEDGRRRLGDTDPADLSGGAKTSVMVVASATRLPHGQIKMV